MPRCWCWMRLSGERGAPSRSVSRESRHYRLIVTKLDGTARGGGLVPVAMKLNLPVYFIGVGEQAEDLQAFNAAEFAAANRCGYGAK